MRPENAILIIAGVLLLTVLVLLFIRKKRIRINAVDPPVFEPPLSELYIANMGGHSILGFKIGETGAVGSSPVRVIQGPATGLRNPFDVAADSFGRIWVINLGDPPGSQRSITVYDPTANGNAPPVTVKQLTTDFDESPFPTAIASRLHILVADTLVNRVIEFTMSQSNTLISTVGIVGPLTQIIHPTGIAVDDSQRVFVAVSSLPVIFGLYVLSNQPASAILVFNVSSFQGISALPPVAIIAGSATGLNNPAHICFDDQGDLYVVNRGTFNPNINNTSITVYAAGQAGNTAPIRTISGPATLLNQHSNPYGIAADKTGQLFVSVQNSVLVFAAGANGNVAPDHIINNQDISSPIGLAIRSTGYSG